MSNLDKEQVRKIVEKTIEEYKKIEESKKMRTIKTIEDAIEYVKSCDSGDIRFLQDVADHGWNNVTNGDLYNDDGSSPVEIQDAAKERLEELED
jgi:Asp-tRNA(Asn)/Glu-tRNA(Gln) amidotransferase C subunit